MQEKEKSKTKPIVTKMAMVNLHISHDGGRRNMKDIANKVEKDNKTGQGIVQASIRMFPASMTTEFTRAVSRCRTYYLENSLPWEEGNWRVVPVTKLQQFKDDIEELISKTQDAFDKVFDTGYSKLEAYFKKAKGNLNVIFPTKDELKKKFEISYNIGAITSPDDIRIIGIDSAMRSQIEKQTEERYQAQIEEGLMELTKKLSSQLDNLEERLEEDDQNGKKYSRFMDNLKEQVQVCKDLNVTRNQKLDAACDVIEKTICNWSPEAIKSSAEVRNNIRQNAGSVQEQLAGITIGDDDD